MYVIIDHSEIKGSKIWNKAMMIADHFGMILNHYRQNWTSYYYASDKSNCKSIYGRKKLSVNRTLQLIVQFNSLSNVQIQAVDSLSQVI